MKKIYKLFFIIILYFACISFVLAENLKCVYTLNDDNVTLRINQQKEKISPEYDGKLIRRVLGNQHNYVYVVDEYIDSVYTDSYLVSNYFNNKCTEYVYLCNSDSNPFYFWVVVDPSHVQTNISFQYKKNNYSYVYDDCKLFNYNSSLSNADSENIDAECKVYNELISSVKKSPCYNSNCSINEKNEFNKQVDEIKSYCKSLLQNADYINPCVQACNKLESDLNIQGSIYNEASCGLSDRLIGFIANLLKWVKFVIPVLVIIFGILDFIKAVGADKEDEMKKAQGKFAKRLIAAALIFIVPFILEFILNKMGFITEGCGILDF